MTFICKNIKGIPSENFKIKIFYKRKFNKNLGLKLKFHAEHVKRDFKVV